MEASTSGVAGLEIGRFLKQFVKRRGGVSAAGAFLAVVLFAVAVAALRADGVAATDYDLHDAGIWITRQQEGSLGRVNTEVEGVIDTRFQVAELSADYDVLQQGRTVLVADAGNAVLKAYDPATTDKLGEVEGLPAEAVVALGGDTVAIFDRGAGGLFVVAAGSVADLDFGTAAPVRMVEQPERAGVAVGVDGVVHLLDGAQGELVSLDATGAVLGTENLGGPVGEGASVTAVGDRAAVLDPDPDGARLVLGGGTAVDLSGAGAGPVLQQAGPGADGVVVTTDDFMLSVPFDGGAPTELAEATNEGDEAIAAAVVAGCAYGAWQSTAGWAKHCVDGRTDAAAAPELEGQTLAFRVNRGRVLLNEVYGGAAVVYTPDSSFRITAEDWKDALEREKEDQESEEDTPDEEILAEQDVPLNECTGDNQAPVAGDDAVATRPGRPVVVRPLGNDEDSNCDVLVVSALGAFDPELGSAAIVDDGQGVQFTPGPAQSEPASFTYEVDDGRGRTAGARITVSINGDLVNGPPGAVDDATTVVSGATVVHDVLANDTDPDGDPLRLAGVSEPQQGPVEFSPDGRVSYTAPGSFVGDVELTYSVTDGREEGTADGALLVTVAPDTNQAPKTRPDYALTYVGREAVVNVLGNDSDANGDTLRLARVIDADANVSPTFSPDGTVRLQTDREGSYYFLYEVTDRFETALGLVRIDVRPAGENHPPTAVRDEAVLRPGGTTLVDVLGNDVDPDGDVLVVRGLFVPADSPLRVEVIERRVLRLTSVVPLAAEATFTYRLSDGRVDADGTVVVQPAPGSTDQAPVASPDVVTVRAGHAVTVAVLGNDIDPDGDVLHLVPFDQAPGIELLAQGQGTLFVQGDELRYLAPETEGTYRAGYVVGDPGGNTDTGQVIFQVIAAEPGTDNRPPEPPTVEARVYAGEAVAIPIPLDRMDPDGDTVFLVGLGAQPLGVQPLGVAELDPDDPSVVLYSSNVDGRGTDRLEYLVRDEFGAVATGSVVVGVVAPPSLNSNPVAVADVAEVRPGEVAVVPVLANDTDAEGDEITFDPTLPVGQPNPGLGSAEVRGEDAVAFTAPAGAVFETQVSFDYGITDGRGGADRGIVTVTIKENPAGLPPIALDDVHRPVPVGEPVAIDVRANDVDPDGDRAALQISFPEPAGVPAGAESVEADGIVRFAMPEHSVAFIYQVTDDQEHWAQALVVVPLQPAPEDVPDDNEPVPTDLPPIAGADSATTVVGEAVTVDVLANDRDPEGGDVELTGIVESSSRGGQAVVEEDQVIFTPDPDFSGDAAFQYTISDPGGSTGQGSVAVRVEGGENTPPVVVGGVLTVAAGEEATLDLATLASDADADQTLAFSALAGGADGVTGRLSGSVLTVEAAPGTGGTTPPRFTYVVSDGEAEANGAVDVTVTATNAQPPIAVADDVADPAFQGGDPVTIDVLGNDIDPLGQGLDITGVSPPAIGRADNVGGQIVFTPDSEFGRTTFTYTIADRSGEPDRESTATVTMNVVGKPEAPPAPSGTAESRTINLSWGTPANNGGPITSYRVESTDGSVNEESSTNALTLNDLTNGQIYRFTVVAVNEAGESPPSAESDELLPDQVPDTPAAPTAVFGDGSIDVAWSAPAVDGTPITGYTLFPSPGTAIDVGNATSYTVTSLTNGTSYTFSVIATNDAGDSLESPPSIPETPAGAPLNQPAPTAVGGDLVVTVDWAEPDPNGDPVASYALTTYIDGASSGSQTISDPANRTVAVAAENGRSYTFTVTATNKAGESAPSGASGAVVPAGRPFPISSVSAANGDGQATLTFTDPGNNGAAITSYEVAVNGGTPQGLAPNRVVSGLINGTDYSFAVRAVNSVGAADLSPASNTVRPYGVPSAPSVTLTHTGTTMNGNWSQGSLNGGTFVRYDVYYDGALQSGLAQSTSGSWPSGYSETHTLTVHVVTTGDLNEKRSAAASDSETADPPPQPVVTLSRGASAQGKTGCSSVECSYLVIAWSNFAAGNHSYSCHTADNGGVFWSGTISGGSGSVQLACYADASVWDGVYVRVDGVQSNTMDW